MYTFDENPGGTQALAKPEFQPGCPIAWLSTFGEMMMVIENVVASMTELNYSPKDIFAVRLALEEAVVNGIKHGHHYDPAKMVKVRYYICKDYVLLAVQDQGPGFDPARVPDPTMPENLEHSGGRGLLLIQSYSSWVHFNERGNQVTFCKYPSGTLA